MQYAAGASIVPDSDHLRDAIILERHQGWSWRDLQETPAEVVEYSDMIGAALAKKAAGT